MGKKVKERKEGMKGEQKGGIKRTGVRLWREREWKVKWREDSSKGKVFGWKRRCNMWNIGRKEVMMKMN